MKLAAATLASEEMAIKRAMQQTENCMMLVLVLRVAIVL
jgi:hypothetical protein